MQIKINAELSSKDILELFTAKLKESGVDSNAGKITILVYSETKKDFVPVKDIKLVFNKE